MLHALYELLRGFQHANDLSKGDLLRYTLDDQPDSVYRGLLTVIIAGAIAAATLVIIPTRLAVFDLAAIKETIDHSRRLRKPYAVVINAAPAP